ncbi:MAG: PAS domain S-box protein [Candidatus Hodarchaeales archaeon]|jgi:PAS domain S-box-containing protein
MSNILQSIRLLHVDDEEGFLELTKTYLEDHLKESFSFTVESVSNVKKAFEMSLSTNYDAIVSDLQMPYMDGLEFYENFKKENKTIPFIIFTGKSREEIAIKALNLGITHYIKKGSDSESQFQELAHTINNAVRHKRTEEALKASESKSQAMLDAIPDLLFTMDGTGKILTYKGDAKDFIVEPAQFFGKSVSEFLPPELANIFIVNIQKTLSTRKLHHFEYQTTIMGELRYREARMVASADNEVVVIVSERTDQKKTEMALLESELNYRSTLDAILEPIHVVDDNLNITLLNQACANWNKRLGIRNSVLGRNLREIYPFLPSTTFDEYKQVLDSKEVLITEQEIELFGEIFISEVIKIPLIENFEVTKIITFIKDVTDQKKIERQLRENEDRYRTIFEESPIALREEDYSEAFAFLGSIEKRGVSDLNHYFSKNENLDDLKKCASLVKVLYVNKADLKLFGYDSKNEVLGELFKDFDEDRIKVFKEGILSIYEGKTRYNSDLVIYTIDGEKKHVKLNLSMIPASDKITKKAITSLVDISASVEIEEKLIESFDEYHFLFENSPVSLWLEDFSEFKKYIDELKNAGVNNFSEYFDNNPEEVRKCLSKITIEDVNQATLEMFQIKNKNHILGNAEKLLSETSFESFKEEFIALAEGETEFNSKNIPIFIDDLIQYFNLRIVIPEGYKDSFKKVLVSGVDITYLRETEIELIKQRTELSEFAHFMAHDLNNSISVVNGFVELLKQNFVPEYLEKIRKKAYEMSHLLNKSLALADAGLIIEETSNVNIHQIIKSLADTIIPKTIEYQQDRIPQLTGDQDKIYQIFSNIFENAVHHGNPTYIAVKYLIPEEQNLQKIEILNNGKMIPKEFIERIFERGFSTRRSSGLGLAIVKKLVEAHGWHIQVKSDEKLTSFIISMPKSKL